MEPPALVVVLRVVGPCPPVGEPTAVAGPGAAGTPTVPPVELTWQLPPTLAQVLDVLARHALAAHRAGYALEVVAAPEPVLQLLRASGLVPLLGAGDGPPTISLPPGS